MAAAVTASSLFSDNSDNVQAPTISSSVPSVSECSHRGGFRGMFKVPSLVFDIEVRGPRLTMESTDGANLVRRGA